MKSIANIIHHKNFPLNIISSDGNIIYTEYADGTWYIINPDGTYEFGGLKVKSSSGISHINWNLNDYINIIQ